MLNLGANICITRRDGNDDKIFISLEILPKFTLKQLLGILNEHPALDRSIVELKDISIVICPDDPSMRKDSTD